MAQSITARLRSQIHRLRTQAAPQPELGLDSVLPAATVTRVLTEEGGTLRSIRYTPWATFWTSTGEPSAPIAPAGPH